MNRSAVFAQACLLLLTGAIAGCPAQKEQQRAAPQMAPAPFITQDQIRNMEAAAKSAPKNPAGWIALGNAIYDMNRCGEKQGPHQHGPCGDAARAYQTALALDPNNVDVRVDMGTCFRAMDEPDKAIAEYRKAMKIDPGHPHAHMNAGIVLAFDLNRPAEAVKEFERYVQLAPNAPNAASIRQLIADLKKAN